MTTPLELRIAVSNTGPLISALQAQCVTILRQLYDMIWIPDSELAEFAKHGAADEIHELINAGFIQVHLLITDEKQHAEYFAEAIAQSPLTKDKLALAHYPEAEAMVLFNRPHCPARELLLDERAARAVAQAHGIPVIGFAGVLIRAYQQNLLSAEAVRDALNHCRQQGTHYSESFIAEVYQRLKENVS